MDLLLLREIIVAAAAGAAAYTDVKTGLIYDRITYPLIAIGLLLNIFEFNISTFVIAAAVFAVGYVLYYTGKIGGGDVKLFTGISFVLPFLNSRVFIIDVLVAAAVIAVVFLSAYYISKYARKGIKFEENKKSIARAAVIGVAVAVYFFVLLQAGIVPMQTVSLLALPMVFALAFLALENGIRKNFFLVHIKVAELEDDDLIAADEIDAATKEKIGIGIKGIADADVMRRIKEAGMEELPVYRNLPKFAPFVLAGVIVVLLFGNQLAGIFS